MIALRHNPTYIVEPYCVPNTMTTTKNSKNTVAENNLFAIAETSGRQFLFKVNRYYDLEVHDVSQKNLYSKIIRSGKYT